MIYFDYEIDVKILLIIYIRGDKIMNDKLETLSNLFEGTEIRNYGIQKKKITTLVWLMSLLH